MSTIGLTESNCPKAYSYIIAQNTHMVMKTPNFGVFGREWCLSGKIFKSHLRQDLRAQIIHMFMSILVKMIEWEVILDKKFPVFSATSPEHWSE